MSGRQSNNWAEDDNYEFVHCCCFSFSFR